MTPLVERLVHSHGLPWVDDATVNTAAAGRPFLLFLPGWRVTAAETADVATILPELLKAFPGLAAGIAAEAAEPGLAARFSVLTYPCLVLLQDGAARAALPRVLGWGDYVGRLGAALTTAGEAA